MKFGRACFITLLNLLCKSTAGGQPPVEPVKMKGLLKGLRYISQIFDPSVKEPEMQIGNPTDVKHVAHIGWDNASVTAPSWVIAAALLLPPDRAISHMNEFKPTAGGTEGGEAEEHQGGGGGRADQAERPRRAGRGKERRDGGSEGSRRPPKTEVGENNCEGEAAAGAAPKQRRRKARASGGTSSGRSKSSSVGGGGGPSAAARPAAAEDDDGDKCF
uniref:CRIB domain-containing protein n=1 Tax=Oryza meridionalis TaxID=40149 RepID=A0A0E0CSW6_9ORYZ